jgi:hypothetical protein
VSLYEGIAMAIVQAAPTGEVVLSGYTMDGPSFHGVEIAEEHLRPRIRYVDVPPSVHEALESSLSDGFDELLDRLGNGLRRGKVPAAAESEKVAKLLRAVADDLD